MSFSRLATFSIVFCVSFAFASTVLLIGWKLMSSKEGRLTISISRTLVKVYNIGGCRMPLPIRF